MFVLIKYIYSSLSKNDQKYFEISSGSTACMHAYICICLEGGVRTCIPQFSTVSDKTGQVEQQSLRYIYVLFLYVEKLFVCCLPCTAVACTW